MCVCVCVYRAVCGPRPSHDDEKTKICRLNGRGMPMAGLTCYADSSMTC